MKRIFIGVALLLLVGLGAWTVVARRPAESRYIPLVSMAVSPGGLSAAHAFLEKDCQSCHTPGKGVEAANCVTCHANNTALLQMQPTAFHANITSCTPCHLEHQNEKRPTQMDHVALAKIGLRELDQSTLSSEEQKRRTALLSWMRQHGALEKQSKSHPKITPEEAALNCAVCHTTQGQGQTMHVNKMGENCASCHATAQWTIPEFKHPSPNSADCVQCHREPPSHNMMHFNMLSRKVAGKPKAKVSECASCHQTTAWNDIKSVGWYDHM